VCSVTGGVVVVLGDALVVGDPLGGAVGEAAGEVVGEVVGDVVGVALGAVLGEALVVLLWLLVPVDVGLAGPAAGEPPAPHAVVTIASATAVAASAPDLLRMWFPPSRTCR
jgi:hypothetical protein